MNEQEQKQKYNRIKQIVIFILLILVMMMGVVLLDKTKISNTNYGGDINNNTISTDDNATEWQGKQNLKGYNGDSDKIAIPCFDSLIFEKNCIEQKVNIYNPDSNSCYMKFIIKIDYESKKINVWQSDLVKPSKGFYEIQLNQALREGTYNAEFIVECYGENNTQLNGAVTKFILYVV